MFGRIILNEKKNKKKISFYFVKLHLFILKHLPLFIFFVFIAVNLYFNFLERVNKRHLKKWHRCWRHSNCGVDVGKNISINSTWSKSIFLNKSNYVSIWRRFCLSRCRNWHSFCFVTTIFFHTSISCLNNGNEYVSCQYRNVSTFEKIEK